MKTNTQKTIVITGGCGFIGTNLIIHLIEHTDWNILCFDKMTSVSNWYVEFLSTENPRVKLVVDDINNISDYSYESLEHPFAIVNLAAESHVDKSLCEFDLFYKTNVIGSHQVAEWCAINEINLLHFSTDEVYGSMKVDSDIRFVEGFDPDSPRNPYSATKMMGEIMIKLGGIKHGVENKTTILRPCNQFGAFQDSTKFIPVCVQKITTSSTIPLYGEGLEMREWMYVDDTCKIVKILLTKLLNNETLPKLMNIGSSNDISNRELADMICDNLDACPDDVIRFISDPRGNYHDERYAVDNSLITSILGHTFNYSAFETALKDTISWYVDEGGI